MIPALLLNIIQSLVVDQAQSLAKEHVAKVMEDNLSEDQLKMIDAVVDEMPENTFKSVKELLGWRKEDTVLSKVSLIPVCMWR